MALAELARAFYATQAAEIDITVASVLTLWEQLEPRKLSGSWKAHRAGERMFVTISTAQLAAAQRAQPYVARAVTEQDATSDPLGEVQPRVLAGVASDGRDLETLLLQPLIQTVVALHGGADTDLAMRAGATALSRITATQVADAGRAAQSLAITADRTVTGWVRMLVPPSCGRCAVLAGRHYKWRAGFDRHPLCDCTAIPSVENRADALQTDPGRYFRSLSPADQDKHFGKSGAEAIRQGADIGQVVNVGRSESGMSVAGLATREGVTVRGLAGKQLGAESGFERLPGNRLRTAVAPRLMPAEIIAQAAGDRDLAVKLLTRYGYLL